MNHLEYLTKDILSALKKIFFEPIYYESFKKQQKKKEIPIGPPTVSKKPGILLQEGQQRVKEVLPPRHAAAALLYLRNPQRSPNLRVH